MWTLKLKGYESLEESNHIRVPDVLTMANQPMFINVNYYEALEKASPIVRSLLEQVPLKGGYKYVMASSIMNYLSPRTSAIQNAHWHLDPGVPAPHKHDARLHILSSGHALTCTTKFIIDDVNAEMPDELYDAGHRVLREYITANADKWGFVGASVPTNCFVTFTNLNPHIALPPTKHELRYFLRVQESNIESPREWQQVTKTSALIDKNNEARMFYTFEQRDNGIFLRTDI